MDSSFIRSFPVVERSSTDIYMYNKNHPTLNQYQFSRLPRERKSPQKEGRKRFLTFMNHALRWRQYSLMLLPSSSNSLTTIMENVHLSTILIVNRVDKKRFVYLSFVDWMELNDWLVACLPEWLTKLPTITSEKKVAAVKLNQRMNRATCKLGVCCW